MVNKFNEQLVHRIQAARSDTALEDYALYVRVARCKLGWDRADLAKRAGLDRSILAFLENHRLSPDELTKEAKGKIEQALGISCHMFWEQNRGHWHELKQDWGHTRSTERGNNSKSNSTDESYTIVQIHPCDKTSPAGERQAQPRAPDMGIFWHNRGHLPFYNTTSQAMAVSYET